MTSLRTKTLVLLAVCVFVLLAICAWFGVMLLNQHFTRQEEEQMHAHGHRIRQLLTSQFSTLVSVATDWAAWDDVYHDISKRSPHFLQTTLTDYDMRNLRINVMAAWDTRGRLLFARDSQQNRVPRQQVDPIFARHITRYYAHLLPSPTGVRTGVLLMPDGVLLVATAPILRNDHTGPPAGVLCVGRYLHNTLLQQLIASAGIPLSLHLYTTIPASDDLLAAQNALSRMHSCIIQTGRETLIGNLFFADALGQPAFILRFFQPRTIYREGLAFIRTMLLALLLTGIGLTVTVLGVMEHAVFRRLRHLEQGLAGIGAQGDAGARLTELTSVKHPDEFTRVTDAVNTMLGELDVARRHTEHILRATNAQLEWRVAERTHELERERRYLDVAIDVLPLPLVFLHTDSACIRQNAAADQHPYPLPIRRNDSATLLDGITRTPVPPDRHPLQRAACGDVIRGEEYVVAGADDVHHPVLIHAAPIREDDIIIAVVAAFEDITPLKEYDRAKDEFIAVLSHELHTPLTCILGWAELALTSDEVTFLRQANEVVLRNARRQKRLVDEMLDLSRLFHRKLMVIVQIIDLSEQAAQAVENIRHEAETHQLTLTLELPSEPLLIAADEVRIQQCIGNLLQNSVKFTGAGGHVTVSCRRQGERALLTVADTGRGMSPDALAAIFAPFHQVERDERTGGLGLGLTLVRGIVELHNGHIIADSIGPGCGSTFTIDLPLAEMPSLLQVVT